MKIKSIISWLLSATLASSAIVIPITANAADATILFQDDFEGYSEGFAAVIEGNWGKVAVTDVAGTDIFKFYGHKNTATTAPTGYSGIGDTAKIMQIASATDSGIGEGSSLKVTAQSGVGNNQLIKDSGIDSTVVADKELVFTTKFKVPDFVGFGDGVGVYLTSTTSTTYEPTSGNTKIHLTNTNEYKNGELVYLGSRPGSGITDGWAYNQVGTKHNQLWTFGEKVADLQAGTAYTYTVTMTPNSDNKYNVTVNLNGEERTLGQAAYASSSTIPTVEEMSAFAAVRVMRLTHAYYFSLGHTNNTVTLADWLSTGYGSSLGITTSEGLYDNDRAVAYFDDFKLVAQEVTEPPAPIVFNEVTVTDGTGSGTYAEGETVAIAADTKTGFTFKQWKVTSQNVILTDPYAAETSFIMPSEAVTIVAEYTENSIVPPETSAGIVEYFSDDFERYDAINGLSGWSNNKPSQYNSDEFKYFYAQTTTPSSTSEENAYFGTVVGTPSDVAKIQINTGVGSGKALEITGQPRVNSYTMLKSSGVTAENTSGKQIVFETTFKAPNPMTMGEGFGVWTFADAEAKAIDYPSDNTDIIKGSGAPVKNELLYVSSRTKAPSTVKIFAFGEEIATVDHNIVYNYKLTLTPDDNEGYTAIVTLNGVSKILAGINVPTQAEFETYNRVHVSPVTHEWYVWEYGFERSYNNVPENVKGPDGLYEAGRTLGIIDNISLKGCDVFEVEEIQGLNSSQEIALTESAVTLKMTGEISSVNQSKITINEGATILASVDENDASKLILAFGNLKAKTKYKIEVAELLNSIGAEYIGEIELTASDGVDVLPVELNGSPEGIIDRINSNTIKVNVQKHSSVVESNPRVLVLVDKVIDGAYKNVKVYYASVPVTSTSNFAEITNIAVDNGEIIRVFVWNDNTHMKPITNVTIFE